MRRFPLFMVLFLGVILLAGANGCASDPNVEGAKLDLRNKDYDRALENVEKALQRDPNNAQAHLLKGEVLQEQAGATNERQQYQTLTTQMTESYRRAAELDPKLAEDVTQRMRMAYYNVFQKGVQAFNRGQQNKAAYTEAADYFGIAAAVQPDSAGAYVNQAYALINAGNQAAAIGPFEQAIAKGDDQSQTMVFLADLYRTNGRSGDAVSLLERARELYPDDQDVQAQLLNAYIEANQIDRAMQTYSDAVNRDPSNKLYRYNYGSLLLQAERYPEAIEQLQRATEIDPQYGNAYYNLGAAYVNQAVDVSEQINAIDDDLRANRSSLNQTQIQEKEGQIEQLGQQRRSLFEQAVRPLEQAKTLVEASGESPTEVCKALFSAYVQTEQQAKAESIAECAGYQDLN